MRIEYLGGNDPDVAVIGGIHGDEPCGVRAVESVIDEEPSVCRPVALVVANEKAIERGERYVDEDLNRAFPGEFDGPTHESRLAAQLRDEIGDCTVLSMHSTQSYRKPFALVKELDDFSRRLTAHLSVNAVVDVGQFDKGRLFESVPETIEIECGYQGSTEAIENARTIVREFLAVTGVLPEDGRRPQRSLPVYRLSRSVPKRQASSYEVYAKNFEHVPAGESYAVADTDELVADEGFYPVLMSPYGYENLFGYAAERVGTVEPQRTWESSVDS